MDDRKYLEFEQYVKRLTIGEVVQKLKCPHCGGDLNFHDMPDEQYMADGTFERTERLVCNECFLEVDVVQVYKPVKCYVEEFYTEWIKEDE